MPFHAGLRQAGLSKNALAVGYALAGYGGGIALMLARSLASNLLGVLLCAHAMLIAAYLVHEAAHNTLALGARGRNAQSRVLGELMSFVAGGSYASFERIRELHLLHHKERCDVGRFDYSYHNAHHERPGEPWYRLPALHRELFGERPRALLPVRELLRTFHRNRLRRVLGDDYGSVGEGRGRADGFVGPHGVSFLSVV